MNRPRGLALAAAVAGVTAVAGLIPATSVATSTTGDKQLAHALVVAASDMPMMLNVASLTHPGPVSGQWGSCFVRSGYAVTAREHSSGGTPHSGVVSVATVLTTRAEAERYYRVMVMTMSRCLTRVLGHDLHPPSVGQAHTLGDPRYGNASAAWRLPYAFASASAGGGFQKYTDDWIVVRRQRAVLADLFSFWVGWPQGDESTFKDLTVSGVEQSVLKRELARAFAH